MDGPQAQVSILAALNRWRRAVGSCGVAVMTLLVCANDGMTSDQLPSVPEMCTNLASIAADMEYSKPQDKWPSGLQKLSYRSLVSPEHAEVYGRDLSSIAEHLHQMTTASKRQAKEYLFRYCLSDFGYRGAIETVDVDHGSDATSRDAQWRQNYTPTDKCLDPPDWDTIVDCGNQYMKNRDQSKARK